MSNVYFRKGLNYHIKNDDVIKFIIYNGGDMLKVKSCSKTKNNCLKNYKKISSDEYIYLPTGEICKYKKEEFKSKNSLQRSMSKFRELLTNGFNGGGNELFITLTYKQQEENFENAVSDLGNFWDKLKKEYPNLEFAGVIELQELRGSWHIHIIIKNTKLKVLYIPKEKIEKIWNKGIVYVARITNKEIRDLINDWNIEDNKYNAINKVINYMCKTKSKEKIPSGKRAYYCSSGIKFPFIQEKVYSEAQEIIDEYNYLLLSESTLLIQSSASDKILNKIKEEYYKKDE